jgi:hypothetical protein
MPGTGHPAHGILRTVIKDSTDLPVSTNQSFVYMDSDGRINFNGNRNVKVIPLRSSRVSIAQLYILGVHSCMRILFVCVCVLVCVHVCTRA